MDALYQWLIALLLWNSATCSARCWARCASLSSCPVGVFLMLAAHEPDRRRHGACHSAGRGW